jgi:hypothetical protein
MKTALIGFSGFVGGTLLKQFSFDELYRSNNIQDIPGKKFDMVVCAAAPAQKWIAKREPEADRKIVDALVHHLNAIECGKFVLISTVDVFKKPVEVTEETPVDEEGLHAYGLHRRYLEKFVQSRFPEHLIVRLPGLVGPGLRKNIVYDFHNSNNLHSIDSRNIFQFYPMVNLWGDIEIALAAELKLVHLTAAPVRVEEVARQGFGMPFQNHLEGIPVKYDMRTCHAALFGSHGSYQYSFREAIQAIRSYAQSEPSSLVFNPRVAS